MPWRRHELRTPGIALALQAWAGCAAGLAIHCQSMPLLADPPTIPTASIALGAAMVATVGGILRARWSGIACAASALALTPAILDVSTIDFSAGNAELFWQLTMGLLISGAIAAALGSVVSWRTARSTFGSLRSIVS
jgi:hypothetical protein